MAEGGRAAIDAAMDQVRRIMASHDLVSREDVRPVLDALVPYLIRSEVGELVLPIGVGTEARIRFSRHPIVSEIERLMVLLDGLRACYAPTRLDDGDLRATLNRLMEALPKKKLP